MIWPVSAILREKYSVPMTAAEFMDKMALEALVRIPKHYVPKLRAAEQCETLTGKNGSLPGKRNLLSMLERRKRASSASVRGYIVLFPQNRTYRPVSAIMD